MQASKRDRMKRKRVAVVGGGVSGICSIKSLKEEGIEPVCFEKSPYYGGTWRYHAEDIEGLASVTSTTYANNSKEMSALSDYPPPADLPNYLPHYKIYQMINDYCEKFGVFAHINLKHEVLRVKQANDYDVTGRWVVTVKNHYTGEVRSDTYDGVFICTGQFSYPNRPKFPGQERFKGRIMHSKQLRTYGEFGNQRIVVVGIGCSGVDAATETSNFAEQVYLSTRDGKWIFPRLGPRGMPTDAFFLRRWTDTLIRRLPYEWSSWYFETILNILRFDHSLFGLKPPYTVFSQDPVLSDILPSRIVSGQVIVKNNIKSFTEKGVIFEGETQVTEVDAVIMATGYQWKFPFLGEGIITKDGDCLNLYKCMYPAQLPHPTLAIIGFLLPLGPGFPLGESQCRWASLLINRKVKFPTTEEMFEDIQKTYEINCKRYKRSDRLTTRVDFIKYMDDITAQFGAKPNFLKLFFTDQKLFWALWLGPCLPYQYRLQGPHAWSGARNAILTYIERVEAPLRREGYGQRGCQSFTLKLISSLFLLLLFSIIGKTIFKQIQ